MIAASPSSCRDSIPESLSSATMAEKSMTMSLPTVTENFTVLSANVRLAISEVPDPPVNFPASLLSFIENSKTNSRRARPLS